MVSFPRQTHTLLTHVALFTQLTARELVNGLQPNTREDQRAPSADCHCHELTNIASSTGEVFRTDTGGDAGDHVTCSTVETDVWETGVLGNETEN